MTTIEIAPLLRGLSFDGDKGDIVVSSKTLEDAELNCSAGDVSTRYQKGLRSIMVEGVGGFLLGEDYDDALLVPDEVVDAMIEEWLWHADPDKGVLFDGFPRTVYQAHFLDDLFNFGPISSFTHYSFLL